MQWDLIFSNALYAAIAVNAIGYRLIAVGLNVHFGYTGLLNFGQAGFAAIGAYAVAVPIARYGWSLWAAIPIIFVGGLVLGLILGVPTLRLRADYLAIVTIAVRRDHPPRPRLRALPLAVRRQGRPAGLHPQLQDLNPFGDERHTVWAQKFGGYDLFIIVVGWIIVALTSLLVWSLMRSPWGRVLKSIREDEDAARSLGKNVFSYKMQSLVVGGIIGALGGTVIAVGNRAAQPGNYSHDADVLRLHDPHPRRCGPGEGTDHRRDDLLVHDHVRRQHPGRGGARRLDPELAAGWLNITNAQLRPGEVHDRRCGAGGAGGVPAARHLRRPTGAGVRCPMTRAELGDIDARPRPRRPDPLAGVPFEAGVAEAGPDPRRRRRAPPVRRPDRRRRRSRRDPARPHHRPDRPQRRRQVDVLQPAHRVRRAQPRRWTFDGEDVTGAPATSSPGPGWSARSS